jgi:hypothetical protein
VTGFVRGSTGTCPDPECGKTCYTNRREARQASKRNHPGDHMTPYLHRGRWHYGHSQRWRFERIRVDPLPRLAIQQIHHMARGLPWPPTTT